MNRPGPVNTHRRTHTHTTCNLHFLPSLYPCTLPFFSLVFCPFIFLPHFSISIFPLPLLSISFPSIHCLSFSYNHPSFLLSLHPSLFISFPLFLVLSFPTLILPSLFYLCFLYFLSLPSSFLLSVYRPPSLPSFTFLISFTFISPFCFLFSFLQLPFLLPLFSFPYLFLAICPHLSIPSSSFSASFIFPIHLCSSTII